MAEPKEPKRDNTLNGCPAYIRDRGIRIMARMVKRGYDPIVFEGKRSIPRQIWLWGYGRIHHLGKPKKTWTLNSKHIPGKAVDIISASRMWDWPAFYVALREEAEMENMHTLAPHEMCHLEWRG